MCICVIVRSLTNNSCAFSLILCICGAYLQDTGGSCKPWGMTIFEPIPTSCKSFFPQAAVHCPASCSRLLSIWAAEPRPLRI